MTREQTRWIVLSSTAAVVLATAFLIAHRSGAWDHWRAQSYVARSEKLLKTSGTDAARVAAMRALQYERTSTPALYSLLATIPRSDLVNQLAIRARIADTAPNDTKNLFELGLVATELGRFDIAQRTISDLGARGGTGAGQLELRARLAAAQGDFATAEQEASFLLDADPGNAVGNFVRAVARTRTLAPSELPKLDRELEELAQKPEFRLETLRALRYSARRQGNLDRALQFSERILEEYQGSFADQIAHADLAYKKDPSALPSLLSALAKHANQEPIAFGLIASWLRSIGRVDEVDRWVTETRQLSGTFVGKWIRTEALLQRGEWNRMQETLISDRWAPFDYIRLAFLARAYREQGQSTEFTQNWYRATSEALKDALSTQLLAAIISGWAGWEGQYTDLLWTTRNQNPKNVVWALEQLQKFYEAHRDAAGLLQVSKSMYLVDHNSESAANNLAFYSLLENSAPDRAHRLASELYGRHPNNATIASTYAFSLLQKGRSQEALGVLEKLPEPVRTRNDIAPYYVLALRANGRTEEAQHLLAGIQKGQLFPEERELLDKKE